jgi:hypothetical protein
MAKLVFITPSTLEEIKAYQHEIAYLQSLMPFSHWSQTELPAFMEASLGELTLVFLEHLLMGTFSIELRKRSAEIHGIVNPTIKNFLGKKAFRNTLNLIYSLLLDRLFFELNREVIIARIHPSAKGSLGFVRHYGFKKVCSKKEESIWVLRKENYLALTRKNITL